MGQCVPFSEISEHLRKKSDVSEKMSDIFWKKSNVSEKMSNVFWKKSNVSEKMSHVFWGMSIVFSRASLALWHFSKKWGDAGGSDGFLKALGGNRGECAGGTMGIFMSFEGLKRAMRA